MNDKVTENARKAGFNPVTYTGGNYKLFSYYSSLLIKDVLKEISSVETPRQYESDYDKGFWDCYSNIHRVVESIYREFHNEQKHPEID